MNTKSIKQAIIELKKGNLGIARNLLIPVLKNEPKNEQAWLIFITTFESDQEKIDVLKRFLRINPNSIKGTQLLISLKDRIDKSSEKNILPPISIEKNSSKNSSFTMPVNQKDYQDNKKAEDNDNPLDLLKKRTGNTSELPSFFSNKLNDDLGEMDSLASLDDLFKNNELFSEEEKTKSSANDFGIFEALKELEPDKKFILPEINFDSLADDNQSDLFLEEINQLQNDLDFSSFGEKEFSDSDDNNSLFDEKENLFSDVSLDEALSPYKSGTSFVNDEVPASITSIVSELEITDSELREEQENVFLNYKDEVEEDKINDIKEEPLEPDLLEILSGENSSKKKRKKRSTKNKKKTRRIRRVLVLLILLISSVAAYQYLYLPGKLDPYINEYVIPAYEIYLKPVYEKNIKPLLPLLDSIENNEAFELPAMPTEIVEAPLVINLRAVEGEVLVRGNENEDWRIVNSSGRGVLETQFQTNLNARVELFFSEEVSILIEEESRLEIVKFNAEGVEINLISGEIYIKTKFFPIKVTSSVAEIETSNGTILFMTDDILKFGEVNCFTGNCGILTDSGQANIGAGMAYIVQSNQAPGEIQSINENALRAWITLDEVIFDNLDSFPNALVGGTAWNDISMDGNFDENEPVFSDLEIQLKNAQGEVVSLTKTNDKGQYLFSQHPAGDYYISAILPSNLHISPKTTNNMIDSKTNESGLFFFDEEAISITSFDIGVMSSKISKPISTIKPDLAPLAYFLETQKDGLVDNQINELFASSEGSLWVGTPRGLNVYKDFKWESYRVSNGLVNNLVYDLAEDGKGNLFVLTQGSELNLFNGTSWTSVSLPDRMQFDNTVPSATTPKLATSRNGVLWMTFYDTLYSFDGTEWTNYASFENALVKDITSIAVDDKNIIWLSHWGGGISKFDGSTWQYFTTKDGLLSNNVSTLTLTKNSSPIISTELGMMIFENDIWKPIYTSIPESFTPINTIFTDIESVGYNSEETHWIATDSGVYQLQQNKDSEENFLLDLLEGFRVNSISKTTDGTLWFGTEFGVIRNQGGQWINYPNSSSSTIQSIVDVTKKDKNTLVLISQNRVFEFDGEFWIEKSITEINSPIRQISTDSINRTWVMTDNQLTTISSGLVNTLNFPQEWLDMHLLSQKFKITEKNVTWIANQKFLASNNGFGWMIYDNNNGIPAAPITDFYANDTITVVVTDGGGGAILENGIWRFVHQGNGLSTNRLSSVTVDDDGVIWFGTYQAGLIAYDGSTFTSYTTEDGLLNYQINTLAVGNNNILWVGTILGVNAISDGKIFSYTTQDGLSANSVIEIVPMDDGSVWFSTTSGTISHFIP